MFSGILKGVLAGFDVEEVFKSVATKAAGSVAKAPLTALFQKMKVEGRKSLAGKLRKGADALEEGRCADAAAVGADIIDDIKF